MAEQYTVTLDEQYGDAILNRTGDVTRLRKQLKRKIFMNYSYLAKQNIPVHLGAMIIVAFILRAALFIFLIQPRDGYNQPDTPSYHEAALSLAQGCGMFRLDLKQPIFWRTPGYPAYLAPFYSYLGPQKPAPFTAYRSAHHWAIWGQIVLCSFIPLLVFLLAHLLTNNLLISLIAGWFFVVHLGSMLASAYLLTEALGMLFFYTFLILLFRQIIQPLSWHHWSVIAAALALGGYTWMRPMGECIGITASVLLLIFNQNSWSENGKKAAFFFFIFAVLLAPWYIRNYRLTHDFFFCPVSGIYYNCFCVPKILSRLENISIEDAWKKAQVNAQVACYKALQACPAGVYLSPLANKAAAVPIILAYPLWFAWDWFKEVLKTTFDLYAYQLVTLYNGSFTWDPIQEFLSQKLAACLWTQNLPMYMRLAAWAELFINIFLWVGIAYGIYCFVIQPLLVRAHHWAPLQLMSRVWWVAGTVMAATVAPSGGFGYARLRLPIEPLIVILGLIGWYTFWLYTRPAKSTAQKSLRKNR